MGKRVEIAVFEFSDKDQRLASHELKMSADRYTPLEKIITKYTDSNAKVRRDQLELLVFFPQNTSI
jgi:hypothetical protein